MSKVTTQLEINGKTYEGKDLDLILLGMSLGRELEQERIINLITKDEDVMYFLYWWYEGEYEDRLNKAIALIKGEK